jgi:hypothetical protein
MCELHTEQEARIILQLLEQVMDVAGIASAKTDARCLLGLALGRDMQFCRMKSFPRLIPFARGASQQFWNAALLVNL